MKEVRKNFRKGSIFYKVIHYGKSPKELFQTSVVNFLDAYHHM